MIRVIGGLRLCIVWAIAGSLCEQSFGADHEALRFVREGMKNERQRLVRGDYQITIRSNNSDPRSTPTDKGSLATVHGLFNFRSQREFVNWVDAESGIQKKASTTPEASYHYNSQQEQVHTLTSGTRISRKLRDPVGIPDLRMVGLITWGKHFRGESIQLAETMLFSSDPIVFKSEGNGVYLAQWIKEVSPKTATRFSFWIDTKKGFTPFRATRERRIEAIRDEGWLGPWYREEITWDQINGVWVPTSLRLMSESRLEPDPMPVTPEEIRQVHLHPKVSTKRSWWDIQWNSVNQDIGEERFALSAFDPKDGTLIADLRTAAPTVVDIIGDDRPPVLADTPVNRTSLFIVWLGVGLVLLASTIAVVKRISHRG